MSPLNLSDPKTVRWIIVTLSIFTAVVLAIAVFGRATTAKFKPDILTQVMPSLLTGLVAIAAIMERAVAVLNDIWFGKERQEKEEHVRQTSKQLEAARAELHSAWQLHAQLAQEAVRTGNQPAITQAFAAAGPPALATLQSNVTKPAQELDQAGKDLATVTHPYDATSNERRLHRRRKPPTNRRNAHGVRERPVRHPRSRGSRIFD